MDLLITLGHKTSWATFIAAQKFVCAWAATKQGARTQEDCVSFGEIFLAIVRFDHRATKAG